jgi:hypothetical protein
VRANDQVIKYVYNCQGNETYIIINTLISIQISIDACLGIRDENTDIFININDGVQTPVTIAIQNANSHSLSFK